MKQKQQNVPLNKGGAKMRRKTAALGATGLFCIAAIAHAQRVDEIPTNVPGITVVPLPPVALDLQSASSSTLRQYAVPPRPDPVEAPAAYAKWQKAVGNVQQTIRESPRLETTTIHHGPLRSRANIKQIPNTEAMVSASTLNWSGTSVVNGIFSTTEAVISEFVVPAARQAFGECSGGWTYSSDWPGIDGNGSSDVFQAGTESDAYCSGNITQAFYSAWIEWYPNPETRVSSPAVSPGDLLFVEVWTDSPTDGYAYFLNYSTYVSALYHLTAPAGTSLKGSSVEWILERPIINGSLASLTNYISSAWPLGVAWDYAATSPTYYWQAVDPATGTLEVLTMIDSNGNAISAPTLENANFLWFENYGSSCGVATSPPC